MPVVTDIVLETWQVLQNTADRIWIELEQKQLTSAQIGSTERKLQMDCRQT